MSAESARQSQRCKRLLRIRRISAAEAQNSDYCCVPAGRGQGRIGDVH